MRTEKSVGFFSGVRSADTRATDLVCDPWLYVGGNRPIYESEDTRCPLFFGSELTKTIF